MRQCPNCSLPLPEGYVYHCGFEADNYRTIPPTPGRGHYCDHIRCEELPKPEHQSSNFLTNLTALGVTRNYFDKFPLKKNPETEMPVGDFFLAYLWLRGFKVVPLEEGE